MSENLLKYLSGEMTFSDWLDSQEIPEQATKENILQKVKTLGDDAATQISGTSLLDATSIPGSSKETEGTGSEIDENEEEEDDDNDMEIEEMSKVPVQDSDPKTTEPRSFNLPSLQTPSTQDTPMTEEQRQAEEMMPLIKRISDIIAVSQVREAAKYSQPDPQEDDPGDVSDIVTDLQDFKLRRRGRVRGKKYPRNRLNEMLRLNMGQANLHVAKGEFKQAADICMEIIREAPNSGLPFKTLSFIYEEQGNSEMSLQYALIAAFLECHDSGEWLDLAMRCRQVNNKKQELACYDRACKYRPRDLLLQWDRASLHFEAGEVKKAMDYYQHIVKMLEPSDPPQYMEVCKIMAHMYFKLGQSEKASDTMGIACEVAQQAVDEQAINIYLEILLSIKDYSKALEVICKFSDVKVPSSIKKTPPINLPGGDEKTISDLEKTSASELNNFINSALRGDFDFTSNINKNMADGAVDAKVHLQKVAQESGSKSIDKSESNKEASSQNITFYYIPDALPLDIRVKLALVLIHFKEIDMVESILSPMFHEDIDTVGDLYMDIGEALLEIGQYEEAVKYFQEIVASPKYNQAAVWLKLAECYDGMGEVDRCIEAYNMVIEFAPQQVSVRLSLAASLRSQGRNDEALKVLQDYAGSNEGVGKSTGKMESVDVSSSLDPDEYELWHKKCMLLYSEKLWTEFVHNCFILLHNYYTSHHTVQKKQVIGKALMWELFIKFLKVSTEIKEFKKALVCLEAAVQFKPYSESKNYRMELDYYTTTTCLVAGEYSKAFDAFRVLFTHETEEKKSRHVVWDLFTMIVSGMLDKRHHRFSLRLLFKKPDLVPLIIHNGINSHLSGTYKYAIGEFGRAFKEWPTYPLISLLLGVSFLHLSCQKFHTTRHTSILHGMLFIFQYFRLQNENQEAYYNVGRAFHQLGLVHYAVHYYNKALSFPLHNEKNDHEEAEYHPFVDLHRETAFNLSMIYKASGNIELARKTLYKYCWV